MTTLKLRRDDTVEVLVGKDKGKRGKVREVRPEERRVVPGYIVPVVVDTIGAGDGFDAGLVAGQLLGWGPWRSAELANAVGAHALMVRGDYEGFPSMPEALAFMAGQARVTR